jgi:enoyl-CoA hydratase/carnithine racemase
MIRINDEKREDVMVESQPGEAGADILSVVEGRLWRLTLNRPDKLNALHVGIFRRIADEIDRLDLDAVDCLLLGGAGRSFCAGHDLESLAREEETSLEAERFENKLVERLATLPFPVVAAVQGHCYTGGLELVLAADIIVAAEGARFADTHGKFDLVPIWGLTQRLPRRVGSGKAKEMMFSARSYSGAEAYAMGLVDRLVPDADLKDAADALCADILANSARSNRAVKALLRETDGMTLTAGNAWELHHGPGHGPAYQEMIRARRAATG